MQQKSTISKGKHAEDIACEYLKYLGYKIKDRNFHSKFGELDIMCENSAGQLFTVEVKSSQGIGVIDKDIKELGYAFSVYKRHKILKTISDWKSKNKYDGYIPLYILAVTFQGGLVQDIWFDFWF